MMRQCDQHGLGARPHRHGLTAHQIGRVHDQHLGLVQPLVERAPRALQQQRVARRRAPAPGVRSAPARCSASTIRSPLSVTMPGKKRCPISGERGGISTSARPESRLKSWSEMPPSGTSSRNDRPSSPGKLGRLVRPGRGRSRISPSGHGRPCGSGGPFASLSVTSVSPRMPERRDSRALADQRTTLRARATDARRSTGGTVRPASWRAGSGPAAAILLVRSGSRRSPNSTTIAMQPITMGMPTSANSK